MGALWNSVSLVAKATRLFDDNSVVGKARYWKAIGAKEGERQKHRQEGSGTKGARQRITILQNWR